MTDQPTPPLHEQVRGLERQRDRYREHVPDGYFRFMDVHFAEDRGFPEAPTEGDKHTARDGSEWYYNGATWELYAYAPDPVELIQQVRTLESDLVMCREQLAQETERAESYRLDVAALRDALDAPDDADVNQLIDVVHAITELAEKAEYAAQQLPTPDATNPAHLAFIDAGIEALVQDWADGSLPQAVGRVQQAIRAEGARLEAAQQQADAEKSLIEKAAKVIAFAAERNDLGVTESEMWETYLASESRCKYLDYARALHAASLLEGGDEKADADEVAVTKVVEELTLAGIGNDTPSDYYEIAVEGALTAAGLLQGGDEK